MSLLSHLKRFVMLLPLCVVSCTIKDANQSTPTDSPLQLTKVVGNFYEDQNAKLVLPFKSEWGISSIEITKAPKLVQFDSLKVLSSAVEINMRPLPDKNGLDVIEYRLLKQNTVVAQGSLEITLTEVSDAPLASNSNLNTAEEQPVSGQLMATDADGDALTFRISTAPTKGTLTRFEESTGEFTYTPTINLSGTDSFTFVVNDGELDSEIKTVHINLNNVNDIPQANNLIYSIRHRSQISRDGVGTDADGDALSLRIETQPTKGSVSANGNMFYYVPNELGMGTDVFTYTVFDGTARSAVKTVTINLLPQLEGTWTHAVVQLFRRSEGINARPFDCTVNNDWVIAHTTRRISIPAFSVKCRRNSEELNFTRPAVEGNSNYISGSDYIEYRSVPEPASVVSYLRGTVGGYLSTYFNNNDYRSLQNINSDFNQTPGTTTYPHGILLFEYFGDYSLSARLVRKTP